MCNAFSHHFITILNHKMTSIMHTQLISVKVMSLRANYTKSN